MLINEFQKKALEEKYKVNILSLEIMKTNNMFKQKINIIFESLQRDIKVESWCFLNENETFYNSAEKLVSFKYGYKILLKNN